MAGVKKKYIARVPLDFKKEGDLEQHIETGKVLPDAIPDEDIQALLNINAIEEKVKEK